MQIASYIDHTVLKPGATEADIARCCREAGESGFAAVCVPPYYVLAARRNLEGSGVKLATVIGFPFGYSSTAAKIAEIRQALDEGADELDMVHNLAALKNGDWQFLEDEADATVPLVHAAGKIIKLIVESGELTDEELVRCCGLYALRHIDYMKTSTGYAGTGATLRAVHIMRAHLPAGISIKASGGIRTFAFARELIDAGASRLGCSASLQIMAESRSFQTDNP